MILIHDYKDIALNSDFPFINAIINKDQGGLIYKDSLHNYFIINQAGFSQLLFANKTDFSKKNFIDFIASNKLIPTYFHIYDTSTFLKQTFNNDTRFNIKIRERKQMRFIENSIKGNIKNYLLPPNYSFQQINTNNLNQLDCFNLNINSTFWSSENHFLENGYGIVIFNEMNQPVSICYSACISKNISEIDIATLPDYQGKGLGSFATIEYIKYSIKNKIRANWDCFSDNIPSLKTAKKMNFKELKTYNFLSIYKNSNERI